MCGVESQIKYIYISCKHASENRDQADSVVIFLLDYWAVCRKYLIQAIFSEVGRISLNI